MAGGTAELLKQYGALIGKVQNGAAVELRAVRELRARLKEAADGMSDTNPDMADTLREMRQALTDATDQSMVAPETKDWQGAIRLNDKMETLRAAAAPRPAVEVPKRTEYLRLDALSSAVAGLPQWAAPRAAEAPAGPPPADNTNETLAAALLAR